jgi:hypothetical protein
MNLPRMISNSKTLLKGGSCYAVARSRTVMHPRDSMSAQWYVIFTSSFEAAQALICFSLKLTEAPR